MSMITASDLRGFFNMDVTSDDTLLGDLITAAQRAAELYCDTIFESSTLTEYQDGDGSQVIIVKKIPIISVTSIHDDVDRVFGSDALIASDDYVVTEAEGKIELLNDVTTPGLKNLKIVYIAGFSSVPMAVKNAVGNLAFADYIEKNGGVNAVQGQDFVYKPAKLRDAAFKALDPYRKLR